MELWVKSLCSVLIVFSRLVWSVSSSKSRIGMRIMVTLWLT